MKRLIFLMLSLFCLLSVKAQTVTSSPLPIVLISVDGNATIPDAYKVPGTMTILYVNDTTTNYVSNQSNPAYIHYQGRIGIEKRGSTSQYLSKRHYGFETRQSDDVTNDNVSLLGMPEENDWILNPLNYDHSYIRDPLSYALARRTGHYAPRTHYCEVFLGGNYRGIYFLTEKIKVDKNRVNIAKIESTDNTMPKLSGGYMVKADKTTGGDPIAWSTPAHSANVDDVNYIHHYPKPDDVTSAQSAYIESYFDSLQTAMDNHDSSITTGYPSLIDVPSFVDYMIIGELTSNVDIYQLSTFFYKDRKGKLCAGPVWDFNAAYGNDPFATPGRSGYNVWQFDNNDNTGSEFWYQLFHDTQFHRLFCRRWHELTAPGAPLCYDSVVAVIDSLNGQISTLVSRDKQRWNYYFNQPNDVLSMKTWLQNRYTWLNSQLTDTANSLPAVPSLAFTKIHYHPQRYGTVDPDDLEFIGITNLADTMVSLTGVYLSELGISYQFPVGSVIDTAQEIYIAADTAAFRARYGVEAFGQYARQLNNHSQRLVLSDAWGRVIDDVTYTDEAPWPTEADGDGPFLTLVDPYSDNSLGSNWTTDTTLLHLPVCVVPSDVVLSDIGHSTVTVGWSADTLQHQWRIVCTFGPIRDTFDTYSNPFTITGLFPGTDYNVCVMALCDNESTSEWSDTLSFSTMVCSPAYDVSVVVQGVSATACWSDGHGANLWDVSYGPSPLDASQGTIVETADTTLLLSDLEPGIYDLYVRAHCDSATYSPWSVKTTFTISTEGIDAVSLAEKVYLYPNPANEQTTLMLNGVEGNVTLSIIDVLGTTVRHEELPSGVVEHPIQGLPAGIYFVHLSNDKFQQTLKLIMQN